MSPQHQRLSQVVGRFEQATIWVVGDLMLDEYLVGEVGRISPEAPVPVVQVRERFTRLGGAANVARSIAALGAAVSVCGVLGEDGAGQELLSACDASGIDTQAVGQLSGRPTTRKLRVLGQGQQLLRLDWEQVAPVDAELARGLIARLEQAGKPDAIVVSDYAKGFVTPELVAQLVAAGRSHGVPVLIDPKRQAASAYRGATLIKPNLQEFEELVGRSLTGASEATLAACGRSLLVDANVDQLVLTLGARGLLVVRRDGSFELVAASQRQVFDVTGAGDTVLAVLALALASGAQLSQAALLANAAAGIVVGEVGTAAVSADQLLVALRPRSSAKRVSAGQIGPQVQAWKRVGKRVVFTNGCYDLLHAGHLSMLQQCAALGDVLVVGINSDASVRRLKGPNRPLVPEHERAALVGALDCVSAVVVFDEDTPLALLERVRPDVLAKGEDYALEQVVGRELVEGLGGRVALVSLLPEHSTTGLVERIRNQSE